MQIFKLRPYLKTVMWGGDKIVSMKGLSPVSEPVGESWEVSAMPGKESMVDGGDDSGMTISQLIAKYGVTLLGEKIAAKHGMEFPLLVKIIDAQHSLSVQVHPDDAIAAARHNAKGKEEVWYVIHADEGAKIHAGLVQPIDMDDYPRLVDDGRIMHYLRQYEVSEGDVYHIPPGRVHTIGAGNLLAEIQQPSDITYRIYDYGRVGIDGKPRQLHTLEAMDVINSDDVTESRVETISNGSGCSCLIDEEHFVVSRLDVEGAKSLPTSEGAFTVAMCVKGECVLRARGEAVTLRACQTALLAASVVEAEVEGYATLLLATAK